MTELGEKSGRAPDLETDADGSAATLSARAAALVERDILSGQWLPGARLGIHALSAHYGIGATPLREGLSRLVSRGLASAEGQRGFRVASVSRADLEDITATRAVIEAEALRRSMANGDDAWEADIIASLHRLRQTVLRDPETMREGRQQFDDMHKAFHRALLGACGSVRMLRLHDDLYMQAYRYRRVMMSRFESPQDFLREHQELADLIMSRDVETSVSRLTRHLYSTLEVVYGKA